MRPRACFDLFSVEDDKETEQNNYWLCSDGGLGAPEVVVMETRLVSPDAVSMETGQL